MTAGIIINPVAGARRRLTADVAVRRAQAALRRCSVDGEVCVTEQRGNARALARSMIAGGARTVVAWGGDGTINEVAAEVAAAGATLGVVPGGSGNGFARGLGLERRAEAALRTAISGSVRVIDTGSIDGRLFVNVAGIGFDAHMAAAFNRLSRRGAPAYFRAGVRELRSYRAATYTVRTPDETFTMPAFLVAVANCREYGNGALIAPGARPDDGLLELVCIPAPPAAVAVVPVVPPLRGHYRPAAGDSPRLGDGHRAGCRPTARVSRGRRGVRRGTLPARPRRRVLASRARAGGSRDRSDNRRLRLRLPPNRA